MAELTTTRSRRSRPSAPAWPRFVLGKLVSALIVMWLVATVVFFLARLSGDPVALLLPPEATKEQSDVLNAALGLDRPLLVQYGEFLAGVVRLDLGTSLVYGEPVTSLIAERIPATLILAIAALFVALLVAVPSGTFAALRRGRPADTGIITAILVGQSTPAFWVGIVLILIFAVKLQILPASGYGTPAHIVLPAVTLAIYSVAVIARLLRSSLIDVLGLDFIRTARAKGLSEGTVVTSHAMRNASLPIVTVVGLEIGSLLGGAILTEQIFSWPGIGRLTVEAISNRDFPLVQGVVLLFAATFVIVNLLVDLSYTLLDPRVRLNGS